VRQLATGLGRTARFGGLPADGVLVATGPATHRAASLVRADRLRPAGTGHPGTGPAARARFLAGPAAADTAAMARVRPAGDHRRHRPAPVDDLPAGASAGLPRTALPGRPASPRMDRSAVPDRGAVRQRRWHRTG